jgi:hypothetical protein
LEPSGIFAFAGLPNSHKWQSELLIRKRSKVPFIEQSNFHPDPGRRATNPARRRQNVVVSDQDISLIDQVAPKMMFKKFL